MTLNLDSQRQFSCGDTISSQSRPRTDHKTEISRSFDPQLHSTAVGASSSLRHMRAPGRVHYSDTVLYLGGQPGKTSPTRHAMSGVSSHDRGVRSIQSNLPNGIRSFSSNDIKYTDQPAATSSLKHGGSHRVHSSTSRYADVMGGRSFPRGQEVVDANDDDDVLMVDDLDTSPQSLSDDLLVGGASSYGNLRLKEEDGELSDVSELLVAPPPPRTATSVSEEPV